MRLRELINQLQTIEATEGDIQVGMNAWDLSLGEWEIEPAEMRVEDVESYNMSSIFRKDMKPGRFVIFY